MSISKALLKRIKAVESELCMNGSTDAPALIWVDYNTEQEAYTIKEEYMNDKSKVTKVRCYAFQKLSEYVFHPKFDGTCILDLFCAPIPEPNLYCIQGREMRKKVEKGAGFTIDFEVEQSEYLKPTEVNIEVCGVMAERMNG